MVRRCPKAIVLHDRQLPRSRANIDHIAVAPSGVWVIDAKRYKGKIEVRKPWFRDAKLVIAGCNKSKLVDGLARQAEYVQSALDSVAPGVPVQACFCFVNPEGQSSGTKLPLLGTLSISGYPLLYPRKLAKRLAQVLDVSVVDIGLDQRSKPEASLRFDARNPRLTEDAHSGGRKPRRLICCRSSAHPLCFGLIRAPFFA